MAFFPGMIYIATLIFLKCSSWAMARIAFAAHHPSGGSRISISSPQPINASFWPDRFPAKEHCSKCGLCETTFVSHVKQSCAFLENGMSGIDAQYEDQVHGRRRSTRRLMNSATFNNTGDNQRITNTAIPNSVDEDRFGVLHEPIRLARAVGVTGAQWTGVVTTIALSMLESGMVDGVVCIVNQKHSEQGNSSWSLPEPIIARTSEEVLRGRGVKPALAPSLNVLDEIRNDKSLRRLLFCGVGCAVQALRAIQRDLGLEQLYILGTNCADNSPTAEAAESFVRDGVGVKGPIQGYEFMQDFRVHVKTDTGYIVRPYFSLPATIANKSIAKSCLTCFDYTNGLADVVVGYMGAPLEKEGRMDSSWQMLTIRNERGALMVQTAIDAGRLRLGPVATGTGTHEQLASITVQSDAIVQSLIGGTIRDNGIPIWMGEILASCIRNLGPKGINFARYSIDYHLLRNYLYSLRTWGESRTHQRLPHYVRDIVEHYLSSDEQIKSLKTRVLNQLKDDEK